MKGWGSCMCVKERGSYIRIFRGRGPGQGPGANFLYITYLYLLCTVRIETYMHINHKHVAI